MNQQKQIKVTVSPSGVVTMDAMGFRGNQCEEATKHIEVMLGDVTSKERKPEFFQPSNTAASNRLRF